ncbi:hypothetical protein MMC28_000120 [Mycoblastus sanguinarius]|nr:hypothetical protein [Mycoblastus sanguinarius]
MKPPARDIAIDALEDLWRNYDDAKAPAAKFLLKLRPQIMASETKPNTAPAKNGVQLAEDTKNHTPSAPPADDTPDGEQMKNNPAGLPVAAAG